MSISEFDQLDQERYNSTQNGDLFDLINIGSYIPQIDEPNDDILKLEDIDALYTLESNQDKNPRNEEGRIISNPEFFNYLNSSDRSTKKNTKKSEKKSYTLENINTVNLIIYKHFIHFSRFESFESDLFFATKGKDLNWNNEQKEMDKMSQNINDPEKKDIELENDEENSKKNEKGLNYFELLKEEKKNSNSPKIFYISKEKKLLSKKTRKKKFN